jgi:hypothetical protein
MAYHMDIMRKHTRSLVIPQWARRILRLIVRQKTFVQKRIVPSDPKLIRVLQMNLPDDVELLACQLRYVVPSIFCV